MFECLLILTDLPALPSVSIPELPEVEHELEASTKRDGLGLPALPGLDLPEADKLEIEATLKEVVNLLTGLVDSKVLPAKRDGLGLPALPGVALPELEGLGLEPTIQLVLNIVTGLLD